jgi:hypothetical protein
MTLDLTPAHKAIDDLQVQHGIQMVQTETSWRAIVESRNAEIADLKKQIENLSNPWTPNFPGDPGPGKMIVGCAASGVVGNVAAIEKQAGEPCAYRQYWNDGIIDFRPTGPIVVASKRDHIAHRVPVLSGKPGIADLAKHMYRTELVAFFKALNALKKLTVIIIHHEPENDGLGGAPFAESQRWVRQCLDEATAGGRCYVMFIGSLMTYTWTPEGTKKHGNPDTYNPGKRADGRHVWDACGLDDYRPKTSDPAIMMKFRDAVASLMSWGVRGAITEWGVRPEDMLGDEKLSTIFEECFDLNFVMFLYYHSKVNSTGTGWELNNDNGTMPQFINMLQDARTVQPNV